jgi:hypothetical protein
MTAPVVRRAANARLRAGERALAELIVRAPRDWSA